MKIKQDLFLILVIILIALIFFGIGRLSIPNKEPVLIKGLEKASVEDIKAPVIEQGSNEINYKGRVVASSKGAKYHLPNCPGAKQISEKNKIWFDSIQDAEKAGYSPAKNCPELTN